MTDTVDVDLKFEISFGSWDITLQPDRGVEEYRQVLSSPDKTVTLEGLPKNAMTRVLVNVIAEQGTEFKLLAGEVDVVEG